MNPLEIIEPLRQSDKYITTIFMQGSCFQFFQFLKSIFKEAIPCMSIHKDHVVTLIDGKMYDITGQIREEQEQDYTPFSRVDWLIVDNWSFQAHNLLYIAECKFCGEP